MNKAVLAMAVSLSLLSGCAALTNLTQRKPQAVSSYVDPTINEADATQVAKDMADFLAWRMPAAKTTLFIEPVPMVLHGLFLDELTRKGFGIIEVRPDPDLHVVAVRYLATVLDGGVIVRVRFNDMLAGLYYPKVSGKLSISNTYAIREVSK